MTHLTVNPPKLSKIGFSLILRAKTMPLNNLKSPTSRAIEDTCVFSCKRHMVATIDSNLMRTLRLIKVMRS
jgi:hypothetical protein